ncbi:MAG TPA: carboxymuconolactone decarboxylase family protein [Solirubrobacteraceae bacterium]|jgi:alkylhydroperoxidase/carboxymuconolactone decarboxylase family protein YurZ|nr:carboxymuconolactone decarboxylase family protein [Solirubrobacteraceae bacterium]
MSGSARAQEIKADFIAAGGLWDATWETVLNLDPELVAVCSKLASVPRRSGRLEPKTKELVALCVDASSTHLHLPGVRQHIRTALGHGASAAELMEVLELSATVSIHAMNVGIPILLDVASELGQRAGSEPRSQRQVYLQEQFTRSRGYWNTTWDAVLELDPDFFEAYTEFSSLPWRSGVLEPKVKEFMYIAFDASATHLYEVGLRLHIENALGYGASIGEIAEILEIAALIGIQSVTSAAPILAEELARFRTG